MATEWFLALDGDDIGRRLELCMLTNDIDSLTTFSAAFNLVINSLVESACRVDGTELVLFGGDSIMLKINDNALSSVLEIVKTVNSGERFTFSGGYAPTIQGAYFALKLAKSSGKKHIEGPVAGVYS